MREDCRHPPEIKQQNQQPPRGRFFTESAFSILSAWAQNYGVLRTIFHDV